MTPEEQIRLIGEDIRESLEQYVGAPMNGDVERAIGQTIKDQLEKLMKAEKIPTFEPQIKIVIQGQQVEVSFAFDAGLFNFTIK